MKILVIDDAPDIRFYLRALLQKSGYQVADAGDGIEGFERLEESGAQIVVCDWMMPGMSGPDVCRAIRGAEFGRYIYVILLTARTERMDLLAGLEAGADDFLSKPVDAQVLRARLRVAERIIGLQQRLAERNREIQQAYEQIQSDLATAARIQRQMLPTSDRPLAPLRARWLFLAAALVSGDTFNFFQLGPDLVGFYLLDVSGHGIPAALLSASLNRSLAPGMGAGEVAGSDFLQPAAFLARLNEQLDSGGTEVEQFATIVYGTLDKHTGRGEIALAGHPHPIIVRRGGAIDYLQAGGLPVGMFPGVAYTSQQFNLGSGDKLVLYSDGVTECHNPEGMIFGDDRLNSAVLEASRSVSSGFIEALEATLRAWRGGGEFEDDISVLVLERPLSEGSAHAVDSSEPGQADLVVDSDAAAVVEVQTWMLSLAAAAGLDEMRGFQLSCAVVEAVNNCIEHAYGGEPGHEIRLHWRRGEGVCEAEIRDRGVPLPAQLLQEAEEVALDAEGGRGWYIIQQWVDEVSYARDGDANVLTLRQRW